MKEQVVKSRTTFLQILQIWPIIDKRWEFESDYFDCDLCLRRSKSSLRLNSAFCHNSVKIEFVLFSMINLDQTVNGIEKHDVVLTNIVLPKMVLTKMVLTNMVLTNVVFTNMTWY